MFDARAALHVHQVGVNHRTYTSRKKDDDQTPACMQVNIPLLKFHIIDESCDNPFHIYMQVRMMYVSAGVTRHTPSKHSNESNCMEALGQPRPIKKHNLSAPLLTEQDKAEV